MGCDAGAGAASPPRARLTALGRAWRDPGGSGAEVGAQHVLLPGQEGTRLPFTEPGAFLPTRTSTSSKCDFCWVFLFWAGRLPHQNTPKKSIKSLSAEKPEQAIISAGHTDTHLHPKPFPRSAPSSLGKSTTHQTPFGKKCQDGKSLTRINVLKLFRSRQQLSPGFQTLCSSLKLNARNTCPNYQSNTGLPSALSIFSGFLPGFLPVFPSITEDPVFLHRLGCLLLFLLAATHSVCSSFPILYLLRPLSLQPSAPVPPGKPPAGAGSVLSPAPLAAGLGTRRAPTRQRPSTQLRSSSRPAP